MKRIIINGISTNMNDNLQIKNIEELIEFNFIVDKYTIEDYNDFQEYISFNISSTREIELIQLNDNYYIFINFFNNKKENISNNYITQINTYINGLKTLDIRHDYNNINYYLKIFRKSGLLLFDKCDGEFKTYNINKYYKLNQKLINSYEFGAGSGFEILFSFVTGISVNIIYDLLKVLYHSILKKGNIEDEKIDICKINKKNMKKILKFIQHEYSEDFYKDLVLIKMKQNRNTTKITWSYKGISELDIIYKKGKFSVALRDKSKL